MTPPPRALRCERRRGHGHASFLAAHAGVLVPWANTVVETELPAWAGGDMAWHYARLVPAGESTAIGEDFLTELVDAIPGALRQLSRLPLQRVYLACTSAAFTQPGRVRGIAAEAATAVPLVTAFDALTEALHHLNATRIALFTPYPAEITAAEVAQMEACGITVTAANGLGADDGYAGIRPDQVRALIDGTDAAALASAQAVVLSCTGWPTRHLAATLRRRLRKPVLSSNLAIVMHAAGRRDAR